MKDYTTGMSRIRQVALACELIDETATEEQTVEAVCNAVRVVTSNKSAKEQLAKSPEKEPTSESGKSGSGEGSSTPQGASTPQGHPAATTK